MGLNERLTYGMMVPVMASRNLPTLVPPYFWTTQPASTGFPTRPTDEDDEDDDEGTRAGEDEDAISRNRKRERKERDRTGDRGEERVGTGTRGRASEISRSSLDWGIGLMVWGDEGAKRAREGRPSSSSARAFQISKA